MRVTIELDEDDFKKLLERIITVEGTVVETNVLVKKLCEERCDGYPKNERQLVDADE